MTKQNITPEGEEVKGGPSPADGLGVPKTARRRISLDEWKAEGKQLFGDDESKWLFACPSCGGSQSMEDFESASIPGPQVLGNCIGRFVSGRGCDFRIGISLAIFGGFKEVQAHDGDVLPVFEFAPLSKLEAP